MMWTRLWAALRRGGDAGVTAVEFGLIIAGVALVAIPGIIALQNATQSSYQSTLVQDPGVGGLAGDGVNDLPGAPITNTVSLGVPSAPQIGAATPSGNQIQLTWSAPLSDGGSIITSYTVTGTGGATCVPSPATSTSCVTPVLPNGTYSFTVTATNAYGTGQASAPAQTTVPVAVTAPGAPTGLSATGGSLEVNLSWVAPVLTGGSPITDYVVQYRTTVGPGAWNTFTDGTSTTPSATVTGLLASTSYDFQVAAKNAVGTGAYSANATASTFGIPGAPSAVSGTPGNSQVTVSWTAPTSNGGSAITGYTVTSSPGAFTCSPAPLGTTCVVTGLTNGTSYTFTVNATNAVGTGPASAASASVTPRTVPGAPTNVTGTAGNAQVTVSWSAPASNGGSAITGYTVTSSPGAFTCSPAPLGTTCVVTGLANGTSYTFSVTAANVAGTGPSSSASAIVTPTLPACSTVLNKSFTALGNTSPVTQSLGISGATITRVTANTGSPAPDGTVDIGATQGTVVWTHATNGNKSWAGTYQFTSTTCAGTGGGSLTLRTN